MSKTVTTYKTVGGIQSGNGIVYLAFIMLLASAILRVAGITALFGVFPMLWVGLALIAFGLVMREPITLFSGIGWSIPVVLIDWLVGGALG